MNDSSARYFAFISYSHKDEAFAASLQKRLSFFKLPSVMRKGNPGLPKYVRPVFRDKTNLTAGLLQKTLKGELDDSKYLIVVCSPNSANPSGDKHWVDGEVRHFIDAGRRENIIPVIIDGEPNSADPARECFCPALRRTADGDEFLGIDARAGKPGGAGRRGDAERRALVHIVAKMLGLRYDDLWDWHSKERKRRRIVAGSAAFLALSLFAAIVSIMVVRIQAEKRTALLRRSESYASYAQGAMAKGDPSLALLLAREAMNGSGGICSDVAVKTLRDIVFSLERREYYPIQKVFSLAAGDEMANAIAVSSDLSKVAIADMASCRIFDIRTGGVLATIPTDIVGELKIDPNFSYLVECGCKRSTGESVVVIHDLRSGKAMERPVEDHDWGNHVEFDGDGKSFIVYYSKTVFRDGIGTGDEYITTHRFSCADGNEVEGGTWDHVGIREGFVAGSPGGEYAVVYARDVRNSRSFEADAEVKDRSGAVVCAMGGCSIIRFSPSEDYLCYADHAGLFVKSLRSGGQANLCALVGDRIRKMLGTDDRFPCRIDDARFLSGDDLLVADMTLSLPGRDKPVPMLVFYDCGKGTIARIEPYDGGRFAIDGEKRCLLFQGNTGVSLFRISPRFASLAAAGGKSSSCELSKDGSVFMSECRNDAPAGGESDTVVFFDTKAGETLVELEAGYRNFAPCIFYDADMSHAIVLDPKGVIELWDVAGKRRIARMNSSKPVELLALSATEDRFAVCGGDSVSIYDFDCEELATLATPSEAPYVNMLYAYGKLLLSVDSDSIDGDDVTTVYDIEKGKAIKTLPVGAFHQKSNESIYGDGMCILSIPDLYWWNLKDDTEASVIKEGGFFAYSPESRILVVNPYKGNGGYVPYLDAYSIQKNGKVQSIGRIAPEEMSRNIALDDVGTHLVVNGKKAEAFDLASLKAVAGFPGDVVDIRGNTVYLLSLFGDEFREIPKFRWYSKEELIERADQLLSSADGKRELSADEATTYSEGR